jgi:hypothetical protein
MMNFRIIKNQIVSNILGPAEAGRFQTIGFQRQSTGAEEVLGNLRFVQVFYSLGNFGKSGGRQTGPAQHDITYNVWLTASAAAELDLSIINDPESTPEQVSAALLAEKEACEVADTSLDELIDIVYQILMNGNNIDMGLAKGIMSNKWIGTVTKDQPTSSGDYVILTASMPLTLRTVEDVPGDTGTAIGIMNTIIDIDDDDTEQTIVEVDQT